MGHIRDDATVALGLELSDLGIRDADNAVICGVAVKTIRRWRRLYQRRGQPRGQAHTKTPCPVCVGTSLDEPAYAHLFGWYLGDGHIIEARRQVFTLSIFNDAKYTNLCSEVMASMRAVKPGGRPHTRDVPGATVITIGWKHWPCLFPQHGPGRKHERSIALADWQRGILERHPDRFLRGLFHSDGCRTTNWVVKTVGGELKRYGYPRYFFGNESRDILELCAWALDLIGVAWRYNRGNSISVARRDAVAALDTFVGPKT